MNYILLIEDNKTTADIVTRVLTTAGFEVRHFEKGLDATRAARKERPSLVLLDFNLPDVDGRNLILVLKRQLGGSDAPPVVAMTARTSDVEHRVAERFGCDAFVNKPFEAQELVELVRNLVNTPSVNV